MSMHGRWSRYGLLFLAPDLSFVFYLAGPRAGAVAYNTLHSTIGPLLLGLAGYAGGITWARPIALIWLAHIGFDRAAGFGLKYTGAFGDTHLGAVDQGGDIGGIGIAVAHETLAGSRSVSCCLEGPSSNGRVGEHLNGFDMDSCASIPASQPQEARMGDVPAPIQIKQISRRDRQGVEINQLFEEGNC